MRLIDAEEFKKTFVGNRYGTKAIEYYIDHAPTIDAVPVVRCKDCKNYVRHDHRCGRMNHGFKDDFFCSWGERGKADE